MTTKAATVEEGSTGDEKHKDGPNNTPPNAKLTTHNVLKDRHEKMVSLMPKVVKAEDIPKETRRQLAGGQTAGQVAKESCGKEG